MKLYADKRKAKPEPKKKKEKKAKRSKKSSSFLGTIFRAIMMLGIWGIIAIGLVVLWFSHDLPDLKNLQANIRKPSVTIQTYDGTILGTYGDLYEDMVKVQDLPPYVSQALMAVEDRRFYHHFGVDIIGLVRAAYTNYKAQRVVQGGSTLTQQLAKNILFTQGCFSVNDRSYKRKIQEVLLAVWLEWKFTKDQILTMYLNRVYFGSGTYGIDAAARRYFNKSARNLSVFEAAVIAGLLKAPSKYSPAQHPKRAKARAKIVLSLMVEAGYLRDYESYLEQGTKELADNTRERNQGYKYFADWVYETLPSIIGPIDKDIIVITTLETELQHKAESVCLDHLEKMGQELKTSEIAFVAMTPEGAIKAMVGGKDYGSSQYNHVTQAHRQPGSSFKIYIYLAALESGLTPESMMDDSPYSKGNWHPSNFKWKSQGMVNLKTGLARSVNSVSIRLTEQVGPKKIAEVAKRLGITSDMNNDLSISLGTCEATLLELTTACSTFANQGKAVWSYGVLEIRDRNGGILYKHQESPGKPIISATVLQGMREMLREVIASGTGKAANVDSTVSGKTGSNGDRDAWFFGYRDATSDPETDGPGGLVIGVWTGNDNNRPMAKASTGGRMPARIAGAFFRGTQVNKPGVPKPVANVPQPPAPNLDDYLKKL